MAATKDHLQRYGRPVATYSDRHGIFRLKQTKVTVCDCFNNEIVILHEGKEIAYQVFDKGVTVSELTDEKTVNSRVDNAIHQQQASHKTAPDFP